MCPDDREIIRRDSLRSTPNDTPPCECIQVARYEDQVAILGSINDSILEAGEVGDGVGIAVYRDVRSV